MFTSCSWVEFCAGFVLLMLGVVLLLACVILAKIAVYEWTADEDSEEE